MRFSANVIDLGDFSVHHKDWLTYCGGNDRPGEFCYSFSISNDLIQMVIFPTRIPDCDSDSPAVWDLFISSVASICSVMAFPPSGNSDHVFVSVSIDFPSNSQRDAPFHCIAYDYSHADWNGLRDHIFKLSAFAAASEFCSDFRLELMYIFLITSIMSSLAHLHGFQLLVLLP